MRFVSARFIALLFAFAVLLAVPVQNAPAQPAADSAAPAQAEPAAPSDAADKPAREGFGGTLDKFLENDFDATDTAVTEAAASGDKRATTIIEALRDERLYFSAEQKAVYYKDAAGKLFSAETGQAVADEPADLAGVDINNRLRRTIDAALGGLTLMAPDPNKRLESAQAVFKSRETSVLPALDAALEKETDPRVKRALTEARAAVILNSEDASEADKLGAVGVIKSRGDQEAVSLLSGLPAGTPASVSRAARDAIASMQSQLAVWNTLQNAWYGLSLGSVLLLAAIGLAITFGVMGVINMAHGEMVMIGAYVTFVVQETIRTKYFTLGFPGLGAIQLPLPFDISLDYSLLIAVPLAFLVAGFIGILIEQGIIRFLYGRPLETLLATWACRSFFSRRSVRRSARPTARCRRHPG